VLERVYVDLDVDGQTMPFFLDTGTPQTFRRGDADAGAKPSPTTIACIDVGLAYAHASDFAATPDGRPVGGVLGTDLLVVGGVLDLRIRDALFVWSGKAPLLPASAITLPATFTKSKLVVDDVTLDGKKVRLLLDTGSPHVVILSKEPRANEIAVTSFDGTGARVQLFESTIAIAFGDGAPRRVTVDRAASFPALERALDGIEGGEVAGVLGIGALGHERIVIAKDAVRFVL
jgi:hypothetical protein